MDWRPILKLLKYWDGSRNIPWFPIYGWGFHGFLGPIKYSCSISSLVPWKISFNPGKDGHELVAWFNSQIAHSSTEFTSHSLCGCFFLHFGKNIAIVLSNSNCFHFTRSMSIFQTGYSGCQSSSYPTDFQILLLWDLHEILSLTESLFYSLQLPLSTRCIAHRWCWRYLLIYLPFWLCLTIPKSPLERLREE